MPISIIVICIVPLTPLLIPEKLLFESFVKSISKTIAISLWKMLKSAPESSKAIYFSSFLLCFKVTGRIGRQKLPIFLYSNVFCHILTYTYVRHNVFWNLKKSGFFISHFNCFFIYYLCVFICNNNFGQIVCKSNPHTFIFFLYRR